MNYLSQCIKLWLVGALMCVHAVPVQTTPPAIDNEFLASFINDIKHSGDLPSGTTIAVVQGDKLIYRGDFGYRDIAQKLPVNQDTRFYIASATKPFSALNFLLDVRQEPKLEKVTLAEMFPQFPLMQRNNISPQQLLTHTASINNFPLVLATAYIGEHTPQTLQRLVKEHSSTSSEPVGEFKYTNVGYNIYTQTTSRYSPSAGE